MSRTLEIEFYGRQLAVDVFQIKDIDINDIKDIEYCDLDEYSESLGYSVVSNDFFTNSCLPFYINKITIKNNEVIEKSISYNDFNCNDVCKFEYKQSFYWGKIDENTNDIKIVSLDENYITCFGYEECNETYTYILEDFEEEFDLAQIKFIIHKNKNQDDIFPSEFGAIAGIFYKNRKMSIENYEGETENTWTVYHDKEWNKDTRVFYYKEPTIELHD